MRVKQIGNYVVTKRQNPNRGRVYDTRGLAPCLGTMQGGGGRQPHIVVETQRSLPIMAKCVGGVTDKKWGSKQYHQQDRIYYGDIALTHPANIPGGSYHYIVKERNDTDKTSDKTRMD